MTCTLAEKLNQFDLNLPLEYAVTVPSSWYFDAEIYEAECQAVFAGTWQMVGHRDMIPNVGCYFTIQLAGEPILVVRSAEDRIQAFYNVCRHRAAPLVNESSGQATRFRCRYHGWTYDLTGQLRGLPEFDGVAGFCREDNGLVPLTLETWQGFIWVRQPLAAISDDGSLLQHLAPLPTRTAELGLAKLHFVARHDYQLNCNWKVFVDNYLDGGYHVNTVHPGLAGVLDYSQYRTEIAGHTSLQMSPLKPADAAASGRGIGQVRTGANAYYWWVFPNLMMNIYDGVMDTNLVLPLGPDRCRVIFDYYFADHGPEAEAFIRESIAVAHQIQLEDVGICEEVQQGLASRSYSTGRFSVRREAAGYHFHRLLAQRLLSSLPRS